MRRELLKTSNIYHTIQDLSDLARGFDIPLDPVNEQHARSCEPDSDDPSFRGGITTREQLTEILARGWKEGSDQLSSLQTAGGFASLPGVRDRKRRARWSDSGDELNVDRAMRGDWDIAWRQMKRQITSGTQCIDLYAAWGGNAHRSADDMFWSGAQMLVACDLLESAGYRVRLLATAVNKAWEGGYQRADIVIKDDSEPLCMDALAGVLCHAAVFRTMGFREVCRNPWNVGSGLGQMRPLSESPDGLRLPDDAIIVPSAYDRETAVKNIRNVIAKIQGVSVEGVAVD